MVKVLSAFLTDRRPLDRADAILVFGHYLPQVAEHAAQLFHQHAAPVILVSGYYHEKIPAGYRSEAHHYAKIMIQNGVPNDAIIQEEEASNTLENVLLGVSKLADAGHQINSLILVGVPWLMRRARATVEKQFPDVAIGTESFEPPEDMIDEARVARLVGEIDRLDEYHSKGDILCPEIPKQVREATEQLRSLIESRQSENKG